MRGKSGIKNSPTQLVLVDVPHPNERIAGHLEAGFKVARDNEVRHVSHLGLSAQNVFDFLMRLVALAGLRIPKRLDAIFHLIGQLSVKDVQAVQVIRRMLAVHDVQALE